MNEIIFHSFSRAFFWPMTIINYCSLLSGRKLEELEATVVCPQRPVSLLLPAHGGDGAQGHHPAGERVRARPGRQGRQAVGPGDLLRLWRHCEGLQDGQFRHRGARKPPLLQVTETGTQLPIGSHQLSASNEPIKPTSCGPQHSSHPCTWHRK